MRSISFWFGALATITLVFLSLWGWRHAAELVAEHATRPYVAAWAVRSAAIAAAASAQAILLTLVVGGIYPRRLSDDVLRVLAGLVGSIALVSAIALGLAGR